MNEENQIQEVVLNGLMKEYKQVRDGMMSEVRALDDAIATLQSERAVRTAPFEKSLEDLEAKIWLPLQDWATVQEAKKAGKTFITGVEKRLKESPFMGDEIPNVRLHVLMHVT